MVSEKKDKDAVASVDEIDDSAAKAAQDEAADVKEIEFEFGGHTYTLNRAALGSADFRWAVQRGRDALAAEMLLGSAGMGKFLGDQADESGFTSSQKLWDFLNGAGRELGTGNR